jgi:hypothetical protein
MSTVCCGWPWSAPRPLCDVVGAKSVGAANAKKARPQSEGGGEGRGTAQGLSVLGPMVSNDFLGNCMLRCISLGTPERPDVVRNSLQI